MAYADGMTDTARPTGFCYCGCGKSIGHRRWFAAGHDKTAEAAFLAKHHGGTVAQMLYNHGYRGVANRDDEGSVTKAAVDAGHWEDCPLGCGYRGTRESVNNHVDRFHAAKEG